MIELLYNTLTGLSVPALIFLIVSIFLHYRYPIVVLEKCFPRNLGFNLSSYFMDALLVAPILVVIYQWLHNSITTHQIMLPSSTIFSTLPEYVTIFVILILGDFIGYCRHRIEHHRALWPIHVMHHSDKHMNWMTIFRFHPANRLNTLIIDNAFLLVLGFPAWALIINGLIRHYYGMFIHADLPWTFGPVLGKVLVSPAMHRWHHALDGKGMNSNFATLFAFFDLMFGTYYLPGPCTSDLGTTTAKGDSPLAYVKELVNPILMMVRKH
ncbi:sterol desaturase family protein [Methylobacillus flagellatus]|uniref:sterol desaturase family protein n=1 Tax=Methylobacillus flagellatus TaxID=405 RepID=UPI002853C3D0|nr:sterol desaturase family protein [Methylobacillus flagellatus]MDR5172477.1 sterol desaturase family protein [Methylobacillus flagellatus]